MSSDRRRTDGEGLLRHADLVASRKLTVALFHPPERTPVHFP
jgi:hypothetical protein